MGEGKRTTKNNKARGQVEGMPTARRGRKSSFTGRESTYLSGGKDGVGQSTRPRGGQGQKRLRWVFLRTERQEGNHREETGLREVGSYLEEKSSVEGRAHLGKFRGHLGGKIRQMGRPW